MRNGKRGFTLVELSIVLVIIGLLIGGILVAQSMISTTKIQTFVRTIQQFDVAVSNFRIKYNGLPGDSSKMGCIDYGNGNQCDDGIIFAGANYDSEVGNFWVDLQKGGFAYQGKTFSGYNDTGVSVAWDYISQHPNSPSIHASVDSGITAMQCQWSVTSTGMCWTLVILDPAGYAGGGNFALPALLPDMALAIDNKIDDSKPYTGDVRNAVEQADLGSNNDGSCDDGAGKYAPANNDAPHCYMQIHMLKDEDGPAQ